MLEKSGVRSDLPLSQVSPARCQPIVPLRSATTLFGTPALISDWAPMMLRVRPAQLTTIVVSGEGTMSCTRNTSSAPGTLMPVGIETREYSSNGPAVEHLEVGAVAHHGGELICAHAGRAAVVLDEFAEGLARHVHARKQHKPGLGPCGNAAVQIREVRVTGARQNSGRALDQAVIVVNQNNAGGEARDEPRKPDFEAAQRHRARPQQVILRERQFFAHIDQRQLGTVAEHGLDGGGGEGVEFLRSRHRFSIRHTPAWPSEGRRAFARLCPAYPASEGKMPP